MVRLPPLTEQDLFKEIRDIATEQGINDVEGWRTIVDDVVDAHLDWGEFDQDQDLVATKTELYDKWEEHLRLLDLENENPVSDEPRPPDDRHTPGTAQT